MTLAKKMKIQHIAIAIIALSGFALNAKEAPVILDPIAKSAKRPKGVNMKLMSKDPKYGYSQESPILVGSKEEYGGPKAERAYLNALLDASGQPIKYTRKGSGGQGPDGKPLDIYEVTISDGKKVLLWISMYHPKNRPERQPAPVGFYKKRG